MRVAYVPLPTPGAPKNMILSVDAAAASSAATVLAWRVDVSEERVATKASER
jgi:hypothetical protein